MVFPKVSGKKCREGNGGRGSGRGGGDLLIVLKVKRAEVRQRSGKMLIFAV